MSPAGGVRLERRLANLRRAALDEAQPRQPDLGGRADALSHRSDGLAVRIADGLHGQLIRTSQGKYIRLDGATTSLRINRARLAELPAQPEPDVPLICLDTETTGLATAAGTFAFLVGLGWWDGELFRQTQLLLPDQSDEPAFLTALADHLPPDGWLVTYNGRGFDWPLLVARYRMARRSPPLQAGHLDLLSIVRRVFRHRLPDARLRSVEQGLLGVQRRNDVEGWQIPSRYLDVLRGGAVAQLVEVVRHNDEDVRSLARLLVHLEQCFGGSLERAAAPPGDLVGLARAYQRERGHRAALECLEAALAAPPARWGVAHPSEPLWSHDRAEPSMSRRERDRIAAERARLLRRLGQYDEALAAWRQIAAQGGPLMGVALLEVAKALEHRRGDHLAALEAVETAARLADRARRLGRPLPNVEADIARRRRRLRLRLARSQSVA